MRSPARVPADPQYRPTLVRHTVSWLCWGVFAGGVTQQIGFVVRKIGGAPSLVSLTTTGPLFILIFAVLYVPWMERFPSRPMVAATRMAAAGAFLAAAFLATPWQLAAAAILGLSVFRIGDTFYGRFLGLLYPPSALGRMQSFPMFACAAATTIVSVLAGWVLRGGEGAYRWVLPAAGAVGALGASLLFAVPMRRREDPRPPGRVRDAVRDVAADPGFVAWTLVYSVAGIGYWIAMCSLPVYFASVIGMDYLSNGVAQACFMTAYGLSFFPWGRLLDRIRSLPVMTAGWMLVVAGIVTSAAWGSFGWVLAGQVLFGIGLSGNDIAWFPIILEQARGDKVDRYMGFTMSFCGLRAVIGGLGSGLIMELLPGASSRVSLFAAALFICGGIGGMLAIRGRRKARGA